MTVYMAAFRALKQMSPSRAAGFVTHLTKPVSVQALEKGLMLPALLRHST
jgi:hypothetical protein